MLQQYKASKENVTLRLNHLDSTFHDYLKNNDHPGNQTNIDKYRNLVSAVNALWGDDAEAFKGYLNPDFQLHFFDLDTKHRIYANGIPINPFSHFHMKMAWHEISLNDLAQELKRPKCLALIEEHNAESAKHKTPMNSFT